VSYLKRTEGIALDTLFKVYAYVFFFLRGTVKDDRTPNSALALLGGLDLLAATIIKFALDIWLGNVAYPHPRLQAIGMLLVIYAANYVLLIRRGAYRRFDHEFTTYQPRKKRLLRAAVIIAIGVVVAGFFALRGAAFERPDVHM
jgi:hypothetical protein